MGRAIFISYRRDDTEGEAGRLFDDLTRSFGENSVFMDVAGINPGVDFRKAIDDNVASCGVLLAVIGPAWATIADADGTPRLDNINDFVRLEIASALARDVAVIPVLVHGATMPRPEQLPDSLKDLAFRNSVEITHTRWNSDVQLLTAALARYVSPSAGTDTAPVHATVAVQLPPPTPPVTKPQSASRSNLPLILGVVVAAVLAIGVIGFLIFRHPSADLSSFAGTWTNSTPQAGNGLKRLEISANGDQLSIHAWGECAPTDCDWGTQPAAIAGETAKAVWNLGQYTNAGGRSRTAQVIVQPLNGQLSVTVDNTFSDRAPNHYVWTFMKAQ